MIDLMIDPRIDPKIDPRIDHRMNAIAQAIELRRSIALTFARARRVRGGRDTCLLRLHALS
jgi:hypothetical protein